MSADPAGIRTLESSPRGSERDAVAWIALPPGSRDPRRQPGTRPLAAPFRARLAAAGLATASGLGLTGAGSAHARDMKGNAGLTFGVRFGGERPPRFVFGLEATVASVEEAGCSTSSHSYAGGVARLDLVAGSNRRFTLGPVLGWSDGLRGAAADGGVGIEWGRDVPSGPGLIGNMGVEVSGLYLLDARLAFNIPRDLQATGGVRFPPLVIGGCTYGRPLRRGDARAPLGGATRVARGGGRGAPSDVNAAESARRAFAAATWLDRARLEWASVPAFLELVEQLAVCGAPPDLIARSRAAAADELRHTISCGELAATLGDLHLVALDPPCTTPPRAPLRGTAGLVRLAVESFVDGCLGEGAAADQAASEAAAASSAEVAAAQRAIATDEARHAALAWDIVTWAQAADRVASGAALRAAVADARPKPAASPVRARAAGAPDLGVLDDGGSFALRERRYEVAAARLSALLL